jgi:hypothetical protein
MLTGFASVESPRSNPPALRQQSPFTRRSTPTDRRRSPLGVHMNARFVVAALLNLAVFDIASAQPQVVWIDAPSWRSSNYEISYSRRHGPANFEMGGGYRTLSEVQRKLQSLRNWDASMRPSTTGWRLAVIRVEVKAGHPRGDGSGGGGGNNLTSFIQQLQTLRQQIRDLRQMLQRIGHTQANVSSANNTIHQYNNLLAQGRQVFGTQALSQFAPESPIQLQRFWYDVLFQGQRYPRGPFDNMQALERDWQFLLRQFGSRNIRSLGVYRR